jgi:cell division protein FtsW (lipid II flippase)
MVRFAGDSRAVGLAAAISAVTLGLLYLHMAGAPTRLLLMNLAALAIGLVLFALAKPLSLAARRHRGPLLIGLGLLLLLTTLGGVSVEGATRWVTIGGLSIQLSLILVPFLVTTHASRSDDWSEAALYLAVLAIALQPDRAVAVMLMSGIAAIAIRRFDRRSLFLALAAAAGLITALVRPDALPAVPFVDRILYTSFNVDPVAGMAVLAGTCLLFLPALPLLWRRGNVAVGAFAAVWGAAVLAAALGNYPTPLVGYGGSAIIGYLLSLVPLPRNGAAAASHLKTVEDAASDDVSGLRFAGS